MTIEEFNRHNELRDMPYEWIGQGYGYKNTEFDWVNGNDDEIIYIPEHAYEDDIVERDCAYSKRDLINLCFGNESKALELFDEVDWQFPETLLDEWEREDEPKISPCYED